MELYASLLEPELRFLSKKTQSIPNDSIWMQLPQACWQAVGGDVATGNISTLIFVTGTIALKTLDDVQDGHADPILSNNGTAMLLHVLQLIAALPSSDPYQIAHLQRTYTNTILKLCAGQHLDLNGLSNETDYLARSWNIAQKKTAEWFGWGASLYPHYVGDEATAEILKEFGICLGLMHQLANDVRGFFDITDNGDLKACKMSIPIAYLRTVLSHSTWRGEFQELWRVSAHDQVARSKIVEIAQQNGIERYCRVMSVYYAQKASQIIAGRFPDLAFLIQHPNLTLF